MVHLPHNSSTNNKLVKLMKDPETIDLLDISQATKDLKEAISKVKTKNPWVSTSYNSQFDLASKVKVVKLGESWFYVAVGHETEPLKVKEILAITDNTLELILCLKNQSPRVSGVNLSTAKIYYHHACKFGEKVRGDTGWIILTTRQHLGMEYDHTLPTPFERCRNIFGSK